MTTVSPNSFFDPSSLRFATTQQLPFQRLPGFQKHHNIPTANNSIATSFIDRLVKSELETEFQQIHTFVRKHFGLKRKEIEVTLDGHGMAILESPVMAVSKSYLMSDEAAEHVMCRIELDSVTDLNVLVDPNFEAGFPYKFQEMTIAVFSSLDIEQVIDAIEGLPDSQPFELHYDFAATSCELSRQESLTKLRIRSDKLQLESPRRILAGELLFEWNEFEKIMTSVLV